MDEKGRFKDLIKVEELLDSLPNRNNTKMLYYVMKTKKISVDFSFNEENSIDTNHPILRKDNLNFEQKVKYFDEITTARMHFNFIELVKISGINIDIMAGNDVSALLPFNSVVVYARVQDIKANFEKRSVENFTKIMTYISNVMMLADLTDLR